MQEGRQAPLEALRGAAPGGARRLPPAGPEIGRRRWRLSPTAVMPMKVTRTALCSPVVAIAAVLAGLLPASALAASNPAGAGRPEAASTEMTIAPAETSSEVWSKTAPATAPAESLSDTPAVEVIAEPAPVAPEPAAKSTPAAPAPSEPAESAPAEPAPEPPPQATATEPPRQRTRA